MNNALIMSIFTGLLVLIGIAQVLILINQKRQNQLSLIQEYRQRWYDYRFYWANVVFIGRRGGEYYQVADKKRVIELNQLIKEHSNRSPTVWGLESIRCVSNVLSDICMKILQGQLDIKDVYPIFGSELLRQSKPLRNLLDVFYIMDFEPHEDSRHNNIRCELQDWLIYHEGIRRRCLILIDLLWAEAVRLEDLSPNDIKQAAEAKKHTGKIYRKRLIKEIKKLNNGLSPFLSLRLSSHLKNSEFRNHFWQKGINLDDIENKNKEWVKRILREF